MFRFVVILVMLLLSSYSSSPNAVVTNTFVLPVAAQESSPLGPSSVYIPLQKSSLIASPSSPFPSTDSRWACPASCGQSADQWCSSIFGFGGSVTSANCVVDADTREVASFECVCNGASSSSLMHLNSIKIAPVLFPTTTTTTTTTTAAPSTATTVVLPTTSATSSATTSSTTTSTTSTTLPSTTTTTTTTSTTLPASTTTTTKPTTTTTTKPTTTTATTLPSAVTTTHETTITITSVIPINATDIGNTSVELTVNPSSTAFDTTVSSATSVDASISATSTSTSVDKTSLSSTTSSATTTTTTTSSTTTISAATTISSTVTAPSTSSTAVSLTATPTTTTTTTTMTTPSPRAAQCRIATNATAYFQASPFGMFCRATTGTCPTTCKLASSTPLGGGEGASSSETSNSVFNPSLLSFIEDCRYGILSCSQNGTKIVSTCSTCNVGGYTITSTVRNDSTGSVATSCSHRVEYVDSAEFNSSAGDVAPIGSCSGLRNCNGDGCCFSNARCNCFANDLVGYYAGSSCVNCDPRYTRDPTTLLCTGLIPPFLYRLSSLLGTRPSALVAPVLVIAALVSLLSFLVRTRWPSDQERYVVPAGVALVDPVSGYSVSPNSRFFIPARPTASRGIVNQRLSEKQAEVVKNLMKTNINSSKKGARK